MENSSLNLNFNDSVKSSGSQMGYSWEYTAELVALSVMGVIGIPLNLLTFTHLIRKLYHSKYVRGGSATPSIGQRKDTIVSPTGVQPMLSYSVRSWKTVHLTHLSMHLTVANLIILIQACIGNSLWIISYYWYGGPVMCKLYAFFSAFGYHLCSNVMVSIAIPPAYLPFPAENGETKFQCVIGTLHSSTAMAAYQLYYVSSVFYVPFIIILLAYGGIAVSISRQINMKETTLRRSISHHHSSSSLNSSKIKLRFLRLSLAIILAYVISWLPYQIFVLLRNR